MTAILELWMVKTSSLFHPLRSIPGVNYLCEFYETVMKESENMAFIVNKSNWKAVGSCRAQHQWCMTLVNGAQARHISRPKSIGVFLDPRCLSDEKKKKKKKRKKKEKKEKEKKKKKKEKKKKKDACLMRNWGRSTFSDRNVIKMAAAGASFDRFVWKSIGVFLVLRCTYIVKIMQIGQ